MLRDALAQRRCPFESRTAMAPGGCACWAPAVGSSPWWFTSPHRWFPSRQWWKEWPCNSSPSVRPCGLKALIWIQNRNISEYYTYWILIGLYCYLRDLGWIICLLLKRLSWRLQFWTFSWRFRATLAAMHKGAFSRQPPNPANTQDRLLCIDSDFGSAWRHEQCGADRCCAMHCDSHSTQNLWELSGSYST